VIIGHIDNLDEEFDSYPAAIQKGLAFLQEHDFTKMEPGRYDIDGDKIYAMLQSYTTRDLEKCRPETHEKYLDIQYMVKGEEYIGWCVLGPDLKPTGAYNPDRDITFYEELTPESNVLLTDHIFAVLYPHDVHRPCCKVNEAAPALKVVVKIALSCLDK